MIQQTSGSERTVETRRVPNRAPVLGMVLVAAVAFAAAFFHRDNPLVTRAQAYAQSVATASAATYVSPRTLNALLPTAQEIQVSGSIVVGASAQPLKFLEPIDDTIERIAGLVFATMQITGLLAVAMGPVSAVGAVAIGGAACLWLVDRLLGRSNPMLGLARRLGWYGIFLALVLPSGFLGSSLVADRLTESVWTRNNDIVQEIVAPLAGEQADSSWPWGMLDGVEKYRALASNISSRADDLIGSYIAILSVFLFKILVLPVMLTGAGLVSARHFARGG